MAKKREDTWTIHHNPPFEVVDITVINGLAYLRFPFKGRPLGEHL